MRKTLVAIDREGYTGLRLIIVDDDPEIRRILRLLVERLGAEVLAEADNGQAAIEEAERLHPQIMLLDVSMPVMGGIAAARHLKVHLPDLRIILVSQYKQKVYAEEALGIGAKGYILKGSAARELGPAIEKVMDGGTFVSAAIAG